MEYRTQIYLEKKHYHFLKEKAEKDRVSLAQAIRTLIEKEMPNESAWQKDPIWRIDKINFHSGISKGSRHHHDILRDQLKGRRKKQ